jgi:hypothetical protein
MIILMKTMTTNVPTELKSNGLLLQQQQQQQPTAATSSGATFIADTALPSDLGLNLRLLAYRTDVSSENGHIRNEPCVIYAADKPPFGGMDDTDNTDNYHSIHHH